MINIYSNFPIKFPKLNSLNKNIDIYIDKNEFFENDHFKIYILCEPNEYLNSTYNYILENYHKYDLILTHNSDILRLKNSRLYTFGGCWVKENNFLKKNSNSISFLVGGKTITTGHKLRHKIYYKNKNIKNNFDIFISSNFPINNMNNEFKYLEGTKDELFKEQYNFHLCIENSRQGYYFTEKIIDCFQTMTVPIYWGSPFIGKFFNKDGIIVLDTNNEDEIISILNSIDLQKFYNDNIDAIIENYHKSFEYKNIHNNYVKSILDFFS